jgi:hypothetical protein
MTVCFAGSGTNIGIITEVSFRLDSRFFYLVASFQ